MHHGNPSPHPRGEQQLLCNHEKHAHCLAALQDQGSGCIVSTYVLICGRTLQRVAYYSAYCGDNQSPCRQQRSSTDGTRLHRVLHQDITCKTFHSVHLGLPPKVLQWVVLYARRCNSSVVVRIPFWESHCDHVPHNPRMGV